MKNDDKFRHESMQNRKTVKSLLEAITKGVGKGELTLGDDSGKIVLEPDGLLTLRIRADRADGNCRLDFRLTWSEEAPTQENKSAPKVS